MITDQHAAASAVSDRSVSPRGVTDAGPSVHVVRARKLLVAGLVGGLAATVLSVAAFGVLDGSAGVVSALLAAAMVLFFYVVGQFVMVLFADAGARTLLAVSLASYSTRVVLLGLLLLAYEKNTAAWPSLIPLAIFVTTIAVVAGWLAVEVFVFSRLRIEIYDRESYDGESYDGESYDREIYDETQDAQGTRGAKL